MSRKRVLDKETTAVRSYSLEDPGDAAHLSLERAVRAAFPVVKELPTDLIQLAGRLGSNTVKQG